MENNDAGACVAVADPPAARDIASGLTLFQIEESIALLAEAAEEEGLTPDIEQALTTYLQGALEKRDRVAEFIQYCEWMADLAKAEIKRLQGRQKHFEGTADRVSAMVLRVLDFLGAKRLEGRTHTLSKRKCPPSVRIDDETRVPSEFKRVTVTLRLDEWNRLLAAVGDNLRQTVETAIVKREEAIDFKAVKEALNLEREVAGADLVVNRFSLEVR
jgi:Siphovirus Gp157